MRVEWAEVDGVVVQDRCGAWNRIYAAFRRPVTRMLPRGDDHPTVDGDPIDWHRG